MIATGGEVRTDEMSASIRDAWGVEPFNQYATTEGLLGSDCEHHQGIHLFEDLCHVEVVDEHGAPVPDGVLGAKLLMTSFMRHTQPVLRYEITDRVSLTTAPCPCGRPLVRILTLQGRIDDLMRFELPGQASITVHPHVLRTVMAASPELRQYKIVHDHAGLHVLVSLRDADAARDVAHRIERSLRDQLATVGIADPQLDVTVVNEIPANRGTAPSSNRSSRSEPLPNLRSENDRLRADRDDRGWPEPKHNALLLRRHTGTLAHTTASGRDRKSGRAGRTLAESEAGPRHEVPGRLAHRQTQGDDRDDS